MAGQRGLCPFCNAEVEVPAAVASQTTPKPAAAVEVPKLAPPKTEISKVKKPHEEEVKPPTEKQLDYAHNLGIHVPDGISRRELSHLIDEAVDDSPASDGQKEFLTQSRRQISRQHPQQTN